MTTPTMLTVDDDPAVRRFISDSLESLGYEVDEAADGEEGLRRMATSAPGLLIVDYAMPGMTGVDMVMRARETAPALPIIMATGYADMAQVGRVLGTQSILVKPFDIATLANAVAKALPERAAAA